MSIELKIILSAVGVIAVALVVWFVRVFMDGKRLWVRKVTAPDLGPGGMKCPCADTVPVRVHIDADLSCTGREKWKWAAIDKCLAPIVDALQKAGVNMRGSCCSHGKGRGGIDLSDGRSIVIYNSVEESRLAEELLCKRLYSSPLKEGEKWGSPVYAEDDDDSTRAYPGTEERE